MTNKSFQDFKYFYLRVSRSAQCKQQSSLRTSEYRAINGQESFHFTVKPQIPVCYVIQPVFKQLDP